MFGNIRKQSDIVIVISQSKKMANTVTNVVKVSIIPGQIAEGNSIVDSNAEVIISNQIQTLCPE